MNRVFAHSLSWIFNPGCLVLGLLVAGVILSDDLSSTAMIKWLLGLAVFSAIGLVILMIAWARGMVLDADLTTPVNLRERSQIVLVFVSLILMLLIVSLRLGQPQPLHAVLVIILVVGVLVALISSYWKISLHMLGVTLFVTTVLAYDFSDWWPVILLLPAIAWARLRLHRHTPLQLLAGFVLASLVTWLVFRAYGLI